MNNSSEDGSVRQNRRILGSYGESAAISYYEHHGYKLMFKNMHVGKLGEIDLCFRKCYSSDTTFAEIFGNPLDFVKTIVICEVKMRSIKSGFSPAEAVTLSKQNTLRKITDVLISEREDFKNALIRFDVAEVFYDNGLIKRINVIENAF